MRAELVSYRGRVVSVTDKWSGLWQVALLSQMSWLTLIEVAVVQAMGAAPWRDGGCADYEADVVYSSCVDAASVLSRV